MHKIPEDIIQIIYHYLHHDKMKILNQEYKFQFLPAPFGLGWKNDNWTEDDYSLNPDHILHFRLCKNKTPVWSDSGIPRKYFEVQ